MEKYYLAIDIGASSGRHILSHMEGEKLCIEEVYRFENKMVKDQGRLLWDTKHLFAEILNGMKVCKQQGKIPVSMAIDTWAVDYVLLDQQDQILGETYGYRDKRTEGMDEEVYKIIPELELYKRTGIQKQMFNTIYQLMAVKIQTPELLKQAKTLLMLPDYFHFLLTGEKASEYTNATSTQLLNPDTKQWDEELLDMLGYPKEIFLPLQMPGYEVGSLREAVQNEVGFNCKVVLCATHDTGSAVMAMPCVEKDGLYISSGTWSLMGTELEAPICDEKSHAGNFTNEGGYEYRFRYIKNIMGLWMIQSVRSELHEVYSFAELCEMAEAHKDFPGRVNVNDAAFMAPDSMIQAMKDHCIQYDQPVPKTVGELSAVVYSSLAEYYGQTVGEIERNTGKHFEQIYVIGGGSKASYLNQLTANATKKTVCAGPAEATAIGNIMAQMLHDGQWASLMEARKCIFDSFQVEVYYPQ